MASDQPREVGLNDLGQLTLRANVVFAVRCAQRVRPCFTLPANAPRRVEQASAIDAAIHAALSFCRNEQVEAGRAAAMAQLARIVAEETCTYTRFAGFAAVRAAEAAGYAEAYIVGEQRGSSLVDVVAAAFGAGRVLVANADRPTIGMVVSALLADYENLRQLAHAPSIDLGPALDPSETGPLGVLWPGGKPSWISDLEANQPMILGK